MFNDARASGLALFVREGYRTFQDQQQIMNERIREYENQGNSKRRATIKNQNLCLEEYLKKYKRMHSCQKILRTAILFT